MAKGISISMAADTRSFITGVQKGVIEPLDDAAEIIEDLGKDGARDFDRLESSMRDAQRETDDTRKKFSDLQKEIKETGRKSRTDFANPMKKSTDSVKGNLDEVRSEAKQNAAEMFSSFDGSFESIADAAQSTLGGLTSGLGGIPAIAGVAAGAAGLGLVTSAITKQIEDADELKQALTDAYKSAAQEGRNYIDQAAIDAAALEIFYDTSRREAAFADAAKLGVDGNTYVRALAGDADALQFALGQADDKLADFVTKAGGTDMAALSTALPTGDVQDLRDMLAEIAGQHDENREAADGYMQFVQQGAKEERDQIQRTRDTEAERWSEAGRLYDEAAKRGPITVRTEIQQPDTETLRRSIENNFRRRPARVQANVVDRAGKNIR